MRRFVGAVAISLGLAMVLVTAAQPPTATAAPLTTFAPAAIPLTSPELANPLRGQYEWIKNEFKPAGWPGIDVYDRFGWKDIEPVQGQYNFAVIEAGMAKAVKRGGRYGFRVMTVDTCCSDPKIVPSDFTQGKMISAGGRDNFVPDWNSAAYITRWTALMKAIAAKYAKDPRLGFLDIGGYGNWGEWHQYPFESQNTAITLESSKKIIDATVNNFPNTQLVMLVDNPAALQYALGRSPKIGLRVDCLGADGLKGAEDGMSGAQKIGPHDVYSRWKTAPFITEWCGGDAPPAQGKKQVAQYHVSMLSSGNFDFEPSDANFQSANKISGYRYSIKSMTMPASLQPGGQFGISTKWVNSNVAPTYEKWRVYVQLRRPGTTTVAVNAGSNVDLRRILPTGTTPATVNESYMLPANVAPGTYEVAVKVVGPNRYVRSMQLANAGKTADGAYRIGTVTVVATTGVAPAMQPVPRPSATPPVASRTRRRPTGY